jgi:hypothetical protein
VVGRAGWRAAVGATLLAAMALTGCPNASSSLQAVSSEVTLEAAAVPAAGLEVAVDVAVDPSIAWQERDIVVRLSPPRRAVVVALVDPEGAIEAMAVVSQRSPDGLRVRQACDGDACGEGFTVRFVPVPGGESVEVVPTIEVGASGFDRRSPSALDLRVGEPAAPSGDAALVAISPGELAIDADQRVAGTLIELPAAVCDADPWLAVLPGPDGAKGSDRRPQVRVITASADVSVPAGRAVPVPSDACRPGSGVLWVVLAAPVAEGGVTAQWVLVGRPGVTAARAETAEGRSTRSAPLPLRSGPVPTGPLGLPTARASLHLVEGVDADAVARTGGGADWIRVDLQGNAELRRDVGTEQGAPLDLVRWFGTGYAPLVLGPCPAAACPDAVDLTVRSEVPGGPPAVARAQVVVFHLLVEVDPLVAPGETGAGGG